MTSDANPFAALSLIVAPAILTNACSVLIMSTSLLLVRDTRRAAAVLTERAASLHFRAAQGEKRDG